MSKKSNAPSAAKAPKTNCPSHAHHPSHDPELPRVRRIKGQVEAIERMIGEGRYCVEILTQIKAARSALQALESNILKTHLEGCVKQALEAPNSFDAEKKLKEISDLLGR